MSLVILVGVPGAGKTTVGKILASKLRTTFADSDHIIEDQAGKPISDIFLQDGEPAFRELEASVIANYVSQEQGVLALGGGAVQNSDTRELLKKHDVVWLTAGLSQAVDRVGMNKNRPLLLGNVRGQLADLMAKRVPLYEEVARHVVDTNESTPDEVAEKIVQIISGAQGSNS